MNKLPVNDPLTIDDGLWTTLPNQFYEQTRGMSRNNSTYRVYYDHSPIGSKRRVMVNRDTEREVPEYLPATRMIAMECSVCSETKYFVHHYNHAVTYAEHHRTTTGHNNWNMEVRTINVMQEAPPGQDTYCVICARHADVDYPEVTIPYYPDIAGECVRAVFSCGHEIFYVVPVYGLKDVTTRYYSTGIVPWV